MLWILVALGCARQPDDTDMGCVDTDSGADSAIETETEETAETGDTGETEPDTCPAHPTPAPVECVTGTLKMGAPIRGSTEGGGSELDWPAYAGMYCAGPEADLSGPERMYLYEGETADIRLTPECGAMSLRVVLIESEASPCEVAANPWSCELAKPDGGDTLTRVVGGGLRYLVIVDGSEGGNFTLRAE